MGHGRRRKSGKEFKGWSSKCLKKVSWAWLPTTLEKKYCLGKQELDISVYGFPRLCWI